MSLAKRTKKKGIQLRLAADTIPDDSANGGPVDTSMESSGFSGFNPDSVPDFLLEACTTLNINGKDYRVSADDMQTLKELGRGQYGVVELKRHKGSGIEMAVKSIRYTGIQLEQRRALTDLQVSTRTGDCPYLIKCYGALYRDGDVMLCMEVLDCSLDKVIAFLRDQNAAGKPERIPEDIMGRMAVAVTNALHFLKKELHVMHRDVKPSNILVNRAGEIKLCDFGIAGTLNESMAKTRNVGCNMYMAPERLDPSLTDIEGFDIRSDVWSLGITMLELAILKHPFRFKTIFDQIKQVVNDPSPSLPADLPYTAEMRDFCDKCLIKDFNNRWKYDQLLEHPFITHYTTQPVDMSAYCTRVLDAMNVAQPGSGGGGMASVDATLQAATEAITGGAAASGGEAGGGIRPLTKIRGAATRKSELEEF